MRKLQKKSLKMKQRQISSKERSHLYNIKEQDEAPSSDAVVTVKLPRRSSW